MKKFALLMALLCVAPFASRATDVTGNLTNLGLDVANTSLAVTFELKNVGYLGIPRVPSVPSAIARPITTIIPDIAGNLSGSVYPNDLIEVGGILGQTYYRVCIRADGQVYRCDDYLIASTAPFNLALALPLNVPPVPVPPTADSTYLRLDLGNVAALDGGAGNFPCSVVAGTCPNHAIIYSNGSKLQGNSGLTYNGIGTNVTLAATIAGLTGFPDLTISNLNTGGTGHKAGLALTGAVAATSGYELAVDTNADNSQNLHVHDLVNSKEQVYVTPTSIQFGSKAGLVGGLQFVLDAANGYITKYANAAPGAALYLRGNGTQAVFAALAAADLTGTVPNASLVGSGALTVATTSPLTGGASVALGGTVTVACPSCVTSIPSQPIVKRINKTTGCTTGSSTYDNCTDTLTWPVAFADASISVACSGVGASNPRANLIVSAYSGTTVTTETVTEGSAAVSFGEIDCIGVHN